MDEREELAQQETEPEDDALEEPVPEIELPTARIAYVMAIVAVLCGGNGIGIVAAGLFWKTNHSLPGAVGIVIAATAIALLIVAVIVLVHKRHVKKNLNQ